MTCSVVIPTIGRESLRDVIASLAEQDEGPIQIIVADDSLCGASVGEWAPSLNITMLRVGPHAGAAKSRNSALPLCRCDVTLFLDDDMVADRGLVRAHLDVHRRWTDAAGIGFRRRVDHETWRKKPAATWAERSKSDVRERAVGGPDWSSHWWAFFQTCNASVPTKAIGDVGGFDEQFTGWGFEDTDLGYRLSRHGLRAHPVVQPQALHLDPPRDRGADAARLRDYVRNGRRFQRKWAADRALCMLVESDIWRRMIEWEV